MLGTLIEKVSDFLKNAKVEKEHKKEAEKLADRLIEEVERGPLTLNEYQILAARTANFNTNEVLVRLADKPELIRLLNFANGLAGEAGEVLDYVKKIVFHGHELDEDIIIKELGDVNWYSSQVAASLNIDNDIVAHRNIEKLMKRYPEGFSVEDSVNRKE